MQHCDVKIIVFIHGTLINFQSAHTRNAYDTIGQSKKLRNILYKTLVQEPPNVEQIGKFMKRVVGRMIQLWVYKILETMKIG